MKKATENFEGEIGIKKAYFYSMTAALIVLSFVTLAALAVSFVSNVGTKEQSATEYENFEGVHAVFLTNGQVYFGEVKQTTPYNIFLEKIYYLQSERQAQASDLNTQSDVKLIKLGKELHGPEDQMIINRDNVLFIEKLKEDSKVVKAIAEYTVK